MVLLPASRSVTAMALRLERGPGVLFGAAFTGLLALTYYLAAQLGFAASFSAGSVTSVWPPSGVALSGLLLYRWRALPGILLGSVATNLLLFSDWQGGLTPGWQVIGPAFFMSLGSLAQALLAARLARVVLTHQARQRDDGDEAGLTTWRFVAIVMLSCCVASTFGIISLASRHLIGPDEWPYTWVTWWIGDAAGMLVFAPALLWLRLHRSADATGPMADAEEAAQTGSRPGPAARPAHQPLGIAGRLSFPIICIGIGLSMMATFIVGHLEREARLAEFRQQARTLAVALEKNLALSLRDLQSLQAAYYKVEIEPAEFDATVRPLLAHHRWQRSFGWAPKVSQAERERFERAAGAEGLHGSHVRELDAQGRSTVAKVRPTYLPLQYVSPSGPYEHLIGMDLLHHGATRAALARSLATGTPQAAIARALTPDASTRTAVLMFWPALHGVLGEGKPVHDPEAVRGMAIAHIDLGDLLDTTCQELACGARELHLMDPDAPAGVAWASLGSPGLPSLTLRALSQGVHVRQSLTVAGLPMVLIQRPGASGLQTAVGGLQIAVLLSGIGFTALLSGFLAQRRRAEQLTVEAKVRLERQVALRTAELTTSNQSLAAAVRVREQAEAALRRFQWLAESASQGFALANFEGSTVYLNPSLRRLARIERGSRVEGRPLPDFLPPALRERMDADIWPLLRRGEPWTGEVTIGKDEPAPQHLIASFFVLLDDAAQAQYVACALTDITARKRLEHDVEQARAAAEQANQAKSTFLANMSHEIRTPLNAVLGYSQLLREDPELAPQHRQRLGSVVAAGQRLLSLINDVLDLSKIEAGAMTLAPQAFDLAHELRDIMDLVCERAQARGLALRLDAQLPDRVRVMADRAKFGQILINLLGNAIKFTDQGTVSLKAWHDGSAFCFEVRDTGRGMPAEELERLFAPFRQGEIGQLKGGTGLGLSISRKLARLMDGDLVLLSPAGGGTQALLRLPLLATSALAPVSSSAAFHGEVRLLSPAHLRVLVVEDDEDSRTVLCDVLHRLGCDVVACSDGQQALDTLLGGSPLPALVFTDIRMPRMSGLALLGHLRADPHLQALPVVAVTASSMEHQRAHFLAEGFSDFIGKPYAFEAVYRALEIHAGARFHELAASADTAEEPLNSSLGADTRPPPFGVQERALLVALAHACNEGALIQVRSLLERLDPHSPEALRHAMQQALSAYDLERLGGLAQQALASA